MNWLSINQVAEHFETSRQTVMAWIESGELRAEDHARKRGGHRRWRIHAAALEEFSRKRAFGSKPEKTRRPARRSDRLVNKYSPSLQ